MKRTDLKFEQLSLRYTSTTRIELNSYNTARLRDFDTAMFRWNYARNGNDKFNKILNQIQRLISIQPLIRGRRLLFENCSEWSASYVAWCAKPNSRSPSSLARSAWIDHCALTWIISVLIWVKLGLVCDSINEKRHQYSKLEANLAQLAIT